jgi:hypothetical protein
MTELFLGLVRRKIRYDILPTFGVTLDGVTGLTWGVSSESDEDSELGSIFICRPWKKERNLDQSNCVPLRFRQSAMIQKQKNRLNKVALISKKI